ncbi:MAG: glycosyltransferase family 4 protein [Magnetococcus sp. YQC-5]
MNRLTSYDTIQYGKRVVIDKVIITVDRMDFTGFNAQRGGRPLHILMVYHAAYPQVRGGIDAMIQALIGSVTPGCRVSIFSPGDWSNKRLEVQWSGSVARYQLRLRMPWDAQRPIRGFLGWLWEFPVTLWKLHGLLRTQKVDMVHLHTIRDYHGYFRLLRWLGGPPYIVTFHGTDALHFAEDMLLGVAGERQGKGILRWVAHGAAGITAVSAHYARLIQQCHPKLGQVHAIPNGIPLDLHADTSASMAEIPAHLPTQYWLLVGWIDPPKAPDVAVRAWGLLADSFPDVHLFIVGEESLLGNGLPYYPGYLASLHEMIRELGISATVHLTGSLPRATLLAMARGAQGQVFPSLREGLPYVLLEAGLMRLPVVCSDIPAFADVVTHEQDGLLTPIKDAQALAAAVARVASDPVLASRLGQAFHETVCQHYSAERMAERYLDLYHRLVMA